MTYAKTTTSYGVETVADAISSLSQSHDMNDIDMAENPHKYTAKIIISAARSLSKATLRALAARRAVAVDYNSCPF